MQTTSRTNQELTEENSALKQRIKDSEQSKSDLKRAEEKLKEKDKFLESMVQSSAVATFVVDEEHKIAYWNKACEDLTGMKSEGLLGTSDHWKAFYDYPRPCVADIIIDNKFNEMTNLYEAYTRSVLIPDGIRAEGWYPNLGGKNRYILFDAAPIRDDQGKLIAAIETLQDITDRKQTEEALWDSEKTAKRLADESVLIAEMGRIINSTLNIEEVYERFAEKVREIIPFDRIAVNTINLKDYTRVIRYVKGDKFADDSTGKVLSLVGTRTEQVMRTKSSLVFNSKNREEMIKKFPATLSVQFGAESTLMIPLISKDEVIGSMAVHSAQIDAYSEKDLLFIERVGCQIAGAIANAQLFRERTQAEEKLQNTLESLRRAVSTTIQVMVSAVEARDPYTAGHQIRSADLARAIATEMGLPQEKIEGIRMAGSIHDIGKISIPAEILSKPTKLSEIEFSLIKEHARRGFEMLKDVESPWPLAEIVYQHHERMDGSGYPRNLKGEEILMEARILTVADVVEAMASHRPYRAGLGIEAALDEIEKNRGIIYDNAVADACLKLFREKGFKLEGI